MSSVNGISSVDSSLYAAAASSYSTASKKTSDSKSDSADSSGVIYESSASSAASSTSSASTAKTDNSAIVAKLKADAEAQTANLQSIVEKLMLGQSKSSSIASGDDMWTFLASGNYTVDAATKAQAQQDISEDGYWGVNQTSDRIMDFAKALAGNDSSKAEELKEAFEKGFKQATKTWGKDLPSISQDTYDAVEKKFDEWINGTSDTASTDAASADN